MPYIVYSMVSLGLYALPPKTRVYALLSFFSACTGYYYTISPKYAMLYSAFSLPTGLLVHLNMKRLSRKYGIKTSFYTLLLSLMFVELYGQGLLEGQFTQLTPHNLFNEIVYYQLFCTISVVDFITRWVGSEELAQKLVFALSVVVSSFIVYYFRTSGKDEHGHKHVDEGHVDEHDDQNASGGHVGEHIDATMDVNGWNQDDEDEQSYEDDPEDFDQEDGYHEGTQLGFDDGHYDALDGLPYDQDYKGELDTSISEHYLHNFIAGYSDGYSNGYQVGLEELNQWPPDQGQDEEITSFLDGTSWDVHPTPNPDGWSDAPFEG